EVVHDLPTDRGRRDLCCGEEVGHAARVVPDHGDVRGTHQDEVHLADGAGRHGDISDALGDEAVGGRGDRVGPDLQVADQVAAVGAGRDGLAALDAHR